MAWAKSFIAALSVWLFAVAAYADPTLYGRTVTLYSMAYDDPEQPLYVGPTRTVVVSDAVEFGFESDVVQNGLRMVPVLVNIDKSRIEFDYVNSEAGTFATAKFNGFILKFEADCTLFTGAAIDWMYTTLPLEKGALSIDRNTLKVNASGLYHDHESRLAIDLAVTDCPIS